MSTAITLTMRRLATSDPDFESRLDGLLAFDDSTDQAVDQAVANIITDVRKRGDVAVLDYTHQFDKLTAASMSLLELPKLELAKAFADLDGDRRKALEIAAARIRSYHEHQRADSWEYEDAEGMRLGQKVTPLDRVGLYVPGGEGSYPS